MKFGFFIYEFSNSGIMVKTKLSWYLGDLKKTFALRL